MCLRAVLKSFVRPAGETAGVFVRFEEEIPCQRQIPLNYEKTSKEVGSWHF